MRYGKFPQRKKNQKRKQILQTTMDLSTYKVAEELVADIATAEAEQRKVLRHMAELGKVAEDEEVFVTLTHMDKGERTSVCLNMPQKYVVYMLELYERNIQKTIRDLKKDFEEL